MQLPYLLIRAGASSRGGKKRGEKLTLFSLPTVV